jgi:uncharacterized protein YkwD
VASTRNPVMHRRARLELEQLEDRLVLSGVQPTATEQLFLEQLNDARANPAAYGQQIGVDLSNVAAAQPLAFDPLLIAAARGHSQDMNDHAYFGHNSPGGADPGQRITAQGYNWTSWGESIAAGYTSTASALSALIVDAGISDLGHRRHLLAMDPIFLGQTQVGIGIVMNGSGPYQDYYTIDSAAPADSRPFLTGVIFQDLAGTGKYAVGEGLAGVTITVQGAGSTTTFDSGGFSLHVNPGTYTVTASGGSLATPFTQVVTVGAHNQRLTIVEPAQSVPPVNAPPVSQPIVPPQQTVQQANAAFVSQLYQSLLLRAASPSEMNTQATNLTNGTLTRDQLTAIVRGSAEYRQVTTVLLVNQLGRDVLGRQLGGNEVAGWVAWVQSTGNIAGMVNLFVTSPEAHQREWSGWVANAYQTHLGRAAGGGEVSMWIGAFQGGLTQNAFLSLVLSSSEYQGRVGASNEQFVAALYRDVLGRTGSPAELGMWVGLLQQGVRRSDIAASILSSFEYQQHHNTVWAAALYQTYLGRPAGAAEIGNLVAVLAQGVSYTQIEVAWLTSAEYYARALRNA